MYSPDLLERQKACSRQIFRDRLFFLEIHEPSTLETLTYILTRLSRATLTLAELHFLEPNGTRFPIVVTKTKRYIHLSRDLDMNQDMDAVSVYTYQALDFFVLYVLNIYHFDQYSLTREKNSLLLLRSGSKSIITSVCPVRSSLDFITAQGLLNCQPL